MAEDIHQNAVYLVPRHFIGLFCTLTVLKPLGYLVQDVQGLPCRGFRAASDWARGVQREAAADALGASASGPVHAVAASKGVVRASGAAYRRGSGHLLYSCSNMFSSMEKQQYIYMGTSQNLC